MEYSSGNERRNKRKDKKREKKKHPYKSGGRQRSSDITLSSEGKPTKASKGKK